MVPLRVLDVYCEGCQDQCTHVVEPDDPGACRCGVCGRVQPLVRPLAA